MKKFLAMLFIVVLAIPFAGCIEELAVTNSNKELTVTGCRVISEEDNYVTYQTVCDNCGYEYGDPATAHVYKKLMYTVTCTWCGELIYVRLER